MGYYFFFPNLIVPKPETLCFRQGVLDKSSIFVNKATFYFGAASVISFPFSTPSSFYDLNVF